MKLLESLKSVINEIASIGDVQSAIKKKRVIMIYYDGTDNGGKGYRLIEPLCLGYSKKGNLVLRAWETEGASWSEKHEGNYLPGWRLFRLDKIFTFKDTLDKFYDVRPNYNPNGDRSMERVLVNAKFDNNDNNNDNIT
jgi:predicted DNA-binding transcriptional regulator YafY